MTGSNRDATPPTVREGPVPGRLCVPKLCGSDVELANFFLGVDRPEGTGDWASRALLAATEGVPASRPDPARGGGPGGAGATEDPQDAGRLYLTNGGCCYRDLDHYEICVPETRSARAHLAAHHAMLRRAAAARRAVEAVLPEGLSLRVLANNSDGRSHAYGSHANFLITRQLFDELFDRKLHHLLFLASFQVSSIVFAGQGKVGSENRRPAVAFQIAQRADFYETLTGPQTTWHRPLVNSRDEALADPDTRLARLHSIFGDHVLSHVAHVLKMGTMQIVLAMLEAGFGDLGLVLDDPVDAVVAFSHDPDLRRRRPLLGGDEVTAVALQRRFFDRAVEARAAGALATVEEVDTILRLWDETLDALARRDFESLTGRLDWVLKRELIARGLAGRPGCGWDSDVARHLDQIYGSLDPDEGLWLACEAGGAIERLVDEAQIARAVEAPPEDTRAWTRGRLLGLIDPERIEHVDWHEMVVWCDEGGGRLARRRIAMGDPLALGRDDTWPVLHASTDADEIVRAVGVPVEGTSRRPAVRAVARRGLPVRTLPAAGAGRALGTARGAAPIHTDRDHDRADPARQEEDPHVRANDPRRPERSVGRPATAIRPAPGGGPARSGAGRGDRPDGR